jgi:N-glycosidase YbiA
MIDSFNGIYRFLSNFYSCRIMFEGQRYHSVEAAYQAAKTLDTDARQMFEDILPSEAKRMGKLLKLRSDWEDAKLGIMEQLVEQKFQDPFLRSALLDTGEEELVEGNYWNDTFWGVCNGSGANYLGQILMAVRQRIREARS